MWIWLFDPANGLAVGKIRYSGRGNVALDGLSVQVSTKKLGISTLRNTKGT